MENQNLLTLKRDAENCPTLKFRDGQFLFSSVNEEGGIVERFLSDAHVREAFSGLPIDSGWFNLEVSSPAICRWGTGRFSEWSVAFIPPGHHKLELTNDGTGQPFTLERITAPLPGMVVFGIGVEHYIWAVKTEKLDPYQEIYRCPLPNVMQDASVCWGLLKPPRVTAKSIFEAWRLFISSTFNNHMANGKSKRSADDVRVVLKDMARAPQPAHYPVNDLVRQVSVTGVTLDQAIRGYFEMGKMPG
jgi:Prokaryotic E2 family D